MLLDKIQNTYEALTQLPFGGAFSAIQLLAALRVRVSLQIINMPILAAFAGLTVGCVPFLKGLLFGADAPLGFVTDCLEVILRLRKVSIAYCAHHLIRHALCLVARPSDNACG